MKSADALEHGRIYGVMMVSFVSHYREGSNATLRLESESVVFQLRKRMT